MSTFFRQLTSLPPDPLRFWQQIHPSPQYGFFLGSPTGSDRCVYLSAGEPKQIFDSLDAVERSLSKANGEKIPRWVGVLTFDEGRGMDSGLARLPKRTDPIGMPPTFFGDYSHVVKLDFVRGTTTFFSSRGDTHIDRMVQAFHANEAMFMARPKKNTSKMKVPPFATFENMVRSAKQSIRRGDIYQANLSLRFSGRFQNDPISLYRRLCEKNPSPYAGLFKHPKGWIISNSPELLVRIEGSSVSTRPIAGTRPRGGNTRLDRRRSGQLLLSPKERAEHIMLVDLERNDLGRVCRPGSVRVTERYAIERYSHVMHIVSQVQGELRKGKKTADVLRAVFPGGTITGCPKIKSVEIIENLEKFSRGIFYGSAGFFQANGDATFNILIRTAFLKNQRLYIQVGAGIVADSQPRREYKEILAKAQALREAVENT